MRMAGKNESNLTPANDSLQGKRHSALLIAITTFVWSSPIAPADDQKFTPIAWPPEHMQSLPADYLDRLHASLVAGKKRLERLRFSSSQSKDSIGWARYGLPSLILGERMGEINQFFESDKFQWSANPKFGFSLFGTSFMRLYGLMNHRTGPMKGPLSQKAIENLEKEMWRVAKANSKLTEAQRDVWNM